MLISSKDIDLLTEFQDFINNTLKFSFRDKFDNGNIYRSDEHQNYVFLVTIRIPQKDIPVKKPQIKLVEVK